MRTRSAVLAVSLSVLLATDHGSSVSAASSAASQAAAVPLRTLPLLFERTLEGAVSHTRGLSAAIRDRGVEIAIDSRRVRLEFVSRAAVAPRLELPQRALINRITGPRSNWRTSIPTFGRVRLAGVYPGIDAVFYGTDRQLEYDLEVAPGVSPDPIVVAVHGADRLVLDGDGQLLIATGDGTLVQRPPVAYQERDGGRDRVDVRYAISGSEVRFVLGAYDPTRALVIDPIVSYSTYFGVEGDDYIRSAAVDGDGNVVIAGSAAAGQFPVPSLRPRPTPPSDDSFVAKLASDGTPIWLTFLGGASEDSASDVAVGPGNDVFLAGTTYSTDFPVTPGAFDTTPNLSSGSNQGDGFVARLSPDGNDLRYSTYVGGDSRDSVHVLKLDAAGRAHIGGATDSPNFPATAGGPSRAQSDRPDGYVARLSLDGSSLEMSRLIAGDKSDVVRGLAIDSVGEINVVGGTTSDVFPVVNAMRNTKFEPGDAEGEIGWDGYVMRLTTAGEIRFSTYLGGMGEDYAADIALGPDGSLYIAGQTTSDSFPGTSSRRPSFNSTSSDIFVVRMEDNGMRMAGGRYHGGRGEDSAWDMVVDRFGTVWIAGSTTSTDFPVIGQVPSTPRAGTDIVAAQFSPDLWDVYQSGAFGGSGLEVGRGLALDGRGNAWLVGYTRSTNYPVVNPVQPTKKGTSSQSDGVITKLECEVFDDGYTPHRTVGAAGSTGTIVPYMDQGCALTPTTTVDWLQVTEITADRIHYRVDPNPSAVSRTGWIMVEPDWGHRVTQLGTSAPTRSATEVVLNAEDATAVRGSWAFTTDPLDNHFMLRQADRGRPKVTRPEIVPAHYFEMEFYAEAGRLYHLWLLGYARPAHWANDSVHVQFSDSVDSSGNPIYRIGTRSSAEVNLEDCSGCGVPDGLSWEDNGWGSPGAVGPHIRFASTGMHKLWVQMREDGLAVGQIVLSAERYLNSPPPENEFVEEPERLLSVLHARDAVKVAGAWRFAADTTASRGERLWHPDAGGAKVNTPSAAPQHYTEFTFQADAGRPYHVWVRLKAERNNWGNDSVWLQFSDSADASGRAIARIGSATGLDVNLEECSGCGLDGWGWRDQGWGASPAPRGAPVYFTTSGPHTLRMQTREDGVSVDQIVLSADFYLHAPPGPAKRDNTIFE